MIELRDAKYPNYDIPRVKLLWTDPPYGTGKKQVSNLASFDDPADTGYVIDALGRWLYRMDRDGVVCVCCDYRLGWRVIAALDARGWVFRGEVVWEFGLGRPRTSWWPNRHNTVFTFTRDSEDPEFDKSAVPRVKRLAQKDGYPEDRPIGSVWDFTMSNKSSQRVGYPNQKPLEIIRPFILAHTKPGDLVADPFCGSGSVGVAARELGRSFYGCDTNPEAVRIATERFEATAYLQPPSRETRGVDLANVRVTIEALEERPDSYGEGLFMARAEDVEAEGVTPAKAVRNLFEVLRD